MSPAASQQNPTMSAPRPNSSSITKYRASKSNIISSNPVFLMRKTISYKYASSSSKVPKTYRDNRRKSVIVSDGRTSGSASNSTSSTSQNRSASSKMYPATKTGVGVGTGVGVDVTVGVGDNVDVGVNTTAGDTVTSGVTGAAGCEPRTRYAAIAKTIMTATTPNSVCRRFESRASPCLKDVAGSSRWPLTLPEDRSGHFQGT